jgi:hypothetical protein
MSTEYEIMISKKVSKKCLENITVLIEGNPELGYWTMSEFVRLVSRGKLAQK